MRTIIQAQLTAALPARLVEELLDAHAEAKRNYYLGGLRLSAVEGGRFCESVFRILEFVTTATFTPLGVALSTDRLIEQLARLPATTAPDSVRLHIPRSLRVVYDIRNKRDTAHLADGIDPNLQDATLVVTVVDWILAELVRLYHHVTPDQAAIIVDQIVTRSAPVIQDIQGFLKVLRTDLTAGDYCLLLLYQRGQQGAELAQLHEWARPPMRPNLKRTLERLVNERAFAHYDGVKYYVTRSGEKEVDDRRLASPK